MSGTETLAGIVALLGLYILPSIIVAARNHPHGRAIIVLNMLLGWTAVGWIIALLWACSRRGHQRRAASSMWDEATQRWIADVLARQDEILARPRVTAPKRRGRSPEQRKTDDAEYSRQMRENFRLKADLDQARAMSIGITHYMWRALDIDSCPTCKARDGREFRWDDPPPGGHPGQCLHCSSVWGWCRCIAMPIIPESQ